MDLQGSRHLLRGALPQGCGALDVGEEEGYRAGRKRPPSPFVLFKWGGAGGGGSSEARFGLIQVPPAHMPPPAPVIWLDPRPRPH
jgi:hypothetical protein